MHLQKSFSVNCTCTTCFASIFLYLFKMDEDQKLTRKYYQVIVVLLLIYNYEIPSEKEYRYTQYHID